MSAFQPVSARPGAPSSRRPRLLPHLIAAWCGLALSMAPALAQEPASGEMTVSTYRGDVVIPAEPKTVVVFDMASIDTLDALDVPMAGLPTAPFPDYLAHYAGDATPKVGSIFEPDFEAVAALAPDLIIAGGRSSEQTEALARIAPTIDMTVDGGDLLASAFERITTLGAIFGKADLAKQRIADLQGRIAALKETSAGIGTGLIVMTTGNRISAFGAGSRFGLLHAEFGVTPADPGLEAANHGEAVSFEYIADTDPDWLFVIDRDAAIGQGAAAALLQNELVENTKAWRSDHVVYLNPATWYLTAPGLTALETNVEQLTARFDKGS